MKKVLVSMPEDLLAELDRDAEAQGKTRSRVLQEATRRYLGGPRHADPTRARRTVEELQALFDSGEWRPGDWTDYVRELRDRR